MIIEIKLNDNNYKIDVTSDTHIAYRMSIIQDADSKNFGKEKENILGYFSQLPNALKRCVREEISMSGQTVSLDEYIERVQHLNDELRNQMEYLGL